MGWFDEQIRQRKLNDQEVLDEAFGRIADAVMGRRKIYSDGDITGVDDALRQIMGYYRVKYREVPGSITDINERLEFEMRPHGIMRREVKLNSDDWYKRAIGALMTQKKSTGTYIAVLPSATGYYYLDPDTGKKTLVTAKVAENIAEEAICFYRPLPNRELKIKDLLSFAISTIRVSEIIFIIASYLMITLAGILITKANYHLMNDVTVSGNMRMLYAAGIYLICVSLAQVMFTIWRDRISENVNKRMTLEVDAAAMMRMLSLPTDFYRKYSSGELVNRMQYISLLSSTLVDILLNTGLASIASIAYITQFVQYAPALVLPAIGIIVATTALSMITTVYQTRIVQKLMEVEAHGSGLDYQIVGGIQKIKLAGAENRIFSRWSAHFAQEIRLKYAPPALIRFNAVFASMISLGGMIILYFMAIRSGVSVANYFAFNTAYAMVSAAFASLTVMASDIVNARPILKMAEPILKAVPEIEENKKVVDHISGGIELNNVSFRYNTYMPYVLNDLSLKIRPGEYLGIVGETGCGKSTLMRMILGFEKPERGAVYFDGQDLQTLDARSLRRKIGVVMQAGKLFIGSIYDNIVITAPWLSMDDAWEAAEIAGLADDIRQMPMGMHTLISEGSGQISGGQKQRLLIARAVAPKPKVIMLDEATSALDNITQKKVSDAMDGMKCTRIVIAHRLSTIRHCNRIIVLSQGKIIEDGTYDELVAKNGYFAELVERQRLDKR